MQVPSMFIPIPPRLLLPFNDEFIDVMVGLISESFHNLELSPGFGICSDLQTLCTLYQVFSQSNLDAVLNNIAAEAPAIELLLHKKLISDL